MTGASIHVERVRGGRPDRFRAYKVIIDNIEVGKIRRGESRRFEVDAGLHRIRLAVDWCRSRPIDLELEPKQDARLRCWPTAT